MRSGIDGCAEFREPGAAPADIEFAVAADDGGEGVAAGGVGLSPMFDAFGDLGQGEGCCVHPFAAFGGGHETEEARARAEGVVSDGDGVGDEWRADPLLDDGDSI